MSVPSQDFASRFGLCGPIAAMAALFTAAAGVVHVFAGNAHDLSTLVGAGMLAVAAAQVLAALVLVRTERRAVLAGLLALNGGAAVVAVLAHTTGLPVPGLNVPQPFDAQLVAVIGLEVAAVLALCLLLAGGAIAPSAGRWLVPVTVVAVLATAVPASAARHAHTGGHGPGAAAHGDAHADAHGDAAHHDDGEVRYRAFTTGLEADQVEPVLDAYERYFVEYLMRTSRIGLTREQATVAMEAILKDYVRSGEGNGGHGHTGPAPWQPITDEATRTTLAAQLQAARDAAMALPTAADAMRAGYVMVVPYLPGIGAHYVNVRYLADGVLDPAKPEIVLYSGNTGAAQVVGVSYLIAGDRDTPPEGFAGPNDGFHYHAELCWVGRLVIPARTTKQCNGIGGVMRGGTAGATWMSHVWVVPGWESPWGVFSPEHPDLTLAVGRPDR